MIHHLLGAVALNFEQTDAGLRRLPLQIKCRPQLLQCGLGFL
jgi:hypothetical protein